MTGYREKETTTSVPQFPKGFGTISEKSLMRKLKKNALDKQIARGAEIWLNCQGQMIAISISTSIQFVAGNKHCTPGLMLKPILFILFVNNLDDKTEGTLNKILSNTALEGSDWHTEW